MTETTYNQTLQFYILHKPIFCNFISYLNSHHQHWIYKNLQNSLLSPPFFLFKHYKAILSQNPHLENNASSMQRKVANN